MQLPQPPKQELGKTLNHPYDLLCAMKLEIELIITYNGNRQFCIF